MEFNIISVGLAELEKRIAEFQEATIKLDRAFKNIGMNVTLNIDIVDEQE